MEEWLCDIQTMVEGVQYSIIEKGLGPFVWEFLFHDALHEDIHSTVPARFR